MYPKPILGPGLCECGCGQATAVVRKTQRSAGRIKGQNYRFVLGHHAAGGPLGFWSNVPGHLPTAECWEWQGRRDTLGYGKYSGGLAHRGTYEEANGPIQDGLFVLHCCDNPPCVNPMHLFLGTNADNMADMVAKDRPHSGFRITYQDAEAIRSRYAQGGITQAQLGNLYGVTQGIVHRIVAGKVWTREWPHRGITESVS